jgi:carboxypeptidase C (cathepsin A)
MKTTRSLLLSSLLLFSSSTFAQNATDSPTAAPTEAPTSAPTEAPTSAPTTSAPTKVPTSAPTNVPTNAPTSAPTSHNYSVPFGTVSYTAEAMLDYVPWDTLPGTSMILENLTYNSFSGYIDIDVATGKKYFYWFFESTNNPATDPVVLWTNGGPGCTGFLGLFEEHGPFVVAANNTLVANPFSWNQLANMIYIEQPTGVGFSYSNTTDDYNVGDQQAAEDMYTFIQGFYAKFPSYRSNPFHLSSESYGGHYLPTSALQILQQQAANTDPTQVINFKGFMVGNPWTDEETNDIATINKFWGDGLLPIPTYNQWKAACGTPALRSANYTWCDDFEYGPINDLIGNIDPYGVNFPVCDPAIKSLNTYAQRVALFKMAGTPGINPVIQYEACSYTYAYLNTASVKAAIHANPDIEWVACSDATNYSDADYLSSTQGYYNKLIEFSSTPQINILVFSGDGDAVCPTEGTQDWIFSLGYSILEYWTTWTVQDQVAGYITKFNGNLTFATVRDAGHEVASYQPIRAQTLFQAYLNGSLFDQQFVPITSAPTVAPPSSSSPSTAAPTASSGGSSSSSSSVQTISTTTFNGMVFIIIVLTLSSGFLLAQVLKQKKRIEEITGGDIKSGLLNKEKDVEMSRT